MRWHPAVVGAKAPLRRAHQRSASDDLRCQLSREMGLFAVIAADESDVARAVEVCTLKV